MRERGECVSDVPQYVKRKCRTALKPSGESKTETLTGKRTNLRFRQKTKTSAERSWTADR